MAEVTQFFTAVKGKGKFPVHAMKASMGEQTYSYHSYITSALEGRESFTLSSGRFIPYITIEYEGWWVPGGFGKK